MRLGGPERLPPLPLCACGLGRWRGGLHSLPPLTQRIIPYIHGILSVPSFHPPTSPGTQTSNSHWADEDIEAREGDGTSQGHEPDGDARWRPVSQLPMPQFHQATDGPKARLENS